MRYENLPYKPCGIVKDGKPCEVLIPHHQSACTACAKDLMDELERLADDEHKARPRRKTMVPSRC